MRSRADRVARGVVLGVVAAAAMAAASAAVASRVQAQASAAPSLALMPMPASMKLTNSRVAIAQSTTVALRAFQDDRLRAVLEDDQAFLAGLRVIGPEFVVRRRRPDERSGRR